MLAGKSKWKGRRSSNVDKLIKGYRRVSTLEELIEEVSFHPVILTLPVYDKMTDTFWKSPIHKHAVTIFEPMGLSIR